MPNKKIISTEYSIRNKAKLVTGGTPYFELVLQMINQATESIHLQTYIFDDDETGQLVADALSAAARRKVQVHLLADGYASQVMSKIFIDSLTAAGINFRFFEPFFKSRHYYFGRRLHHKVLVVDAKFALVGGINITNRYNDMPKSRAWLDFAIYVEGEIAKELCVLCWKTWNNFSEKMGLTPCEEKEYHYDFRQEDMCSLRMRRNDWIRRKNEISETYINMLRHARSHIIIVSSYFLPGKAIRRLLKAASRRGVKIQVITAGNSDVPVAKYAERWLYDWMLRNKIEIFEYQSTVLHGKVSVCDSEWFTIGSYNINNLSAYASIELNVDVYNAALATRAEELLRSIMEKDCITITPDLHKRIKNPVKQFIRWCSYQFIRIIFYLVTFNFRQIR